MGQSFASYDKSYKIIDKYARQQKTKRPQLSPEQIIMVSDTVNKEIGGCCYSGRKLVKNNELFNKFCFKQQFGAKWLKITGRREPVGLSDELLDLYLKNFVDCEGPINYTFINYMSITNFT